jgi:hypothetical protein
MFQNQGTLNMGTYEMGLSLPIEQSGNFPFRAAQNQLAIRGRCTILLENYNFFQLWKMEF